VIVDDIAVLGLHLIGVAHMAKKPARSTKKTAVVSADPLAVALFELINAISTQAVAGMARIPPASLWSRSTAAR
jgi:hypothetical protein